jgi:hypothetical protein
VHFTNRKNAPLDFPHDRGRYLWNDGLPSAADLAFRGRTRSGADCRVHEGRGRDQLRQQSFPELTLRVFPSDHTLQDDELTTLVGWWLNRQVLRETK